VTLLRRTLADMKPVEAMEGLVRQLAKSPSNEHFLARIGQTQGAKGR
jgi:transcription termination factor Rho